MGSIEEIKVGTCWRGGGGGLGGSNWGGACHVDWRSAQGEGCARPVVFELERRQGPAATSAALGAG